MTVYGESNRYFLLDPESGRREKKDCVTHKYFELDQETEAQEYALNYLRAAEFRVRQDLEAIATSTKKVLNFFTGEDNES